MSTVKELVEREEVCKIAREWLKTPFVYGGRVKNAAADCTFVAKVYEEAGVLAPVHIPPYNSQAHINGRSSLWTAILEKLGERIEKPQPGDLVLFEIGHARCHGGIMLDDVQFVHANMHCGVMIDRMDQLSAEVRNPRYYTFW